MSVHCIYGKGYDSNIFVVTGEIPTLIDTGTGQHHKNVLQQIKTIIEPDTIKQIILTHEHFDHCGGLKGFKELLQDKVKIIAHESAAKKIESGDSSFAMMLGCMMSKTTVDLKLKGGEVVTIGDEQYTVIHTPGHTPGCICLYASVSKNLFSGDTIFGHGSFGRTDFPGGNAEQLIKSITYLATLDVRNLYPGHEEIVIDQGNHHIELSLKNTKML